jgi:flavin-dependent dehydrogenase
MGKVPGLNCEYLMKKSVDCVVIGGGPAGSTSAALVAEGGFSTLLLEREEFPRFHVGESLMPETYWTLQRLGVLDEMRQKSFPPKVGVQFVSRSAQESAPFFFDQHDDRACSRTWHVERAEFDNMLFKNASTKGADCQDGARVIDLNLSPDESTVSYQTADGRQHQVRTRVVVDATGQQAMLANRLGLLEVNQRLKKASIWTYFSGAERSEDPDRNITIILHTNDQLCWFWYIPLSNDIVSVGLVGDHDFLLKGRGKPKQTFTEELAKCAGVQRRVAHAKRTEEFHVAKEFSYTTKQHAGDGWVLVGDAFGFIDPVYSSGVFLALKSGEMAADAIVQGLRANDVSAAQLGSWTGEFEAGIVWIRKLVHAFYTNEFSFGKFMKAHPEHGPNLTDLLIGRVFEAGAGKIFNDMDRAIDQARAIATSR